MSATPDNPFVRSHQVLDAVLRDHLLAIVGGDFAGALVLCRTWHQALQAHMELEENRLFPHIPEQARWAARVYRLEHQRIAALATDHLRLVDIAAQRRIQGAHQVRALSLDLLDAAHALRHLLEHHHQREEKALAQELPLALQREVLLPAPDSTGTPGPRHR